MQDKTERTGATGQNYRGWQSDVIVDLIKRYGFPHITLNPGPASAACTIRWSTTAATSRR